MPQTALKIDTQHIVIITQQFGKKLTINAYLTDDNYIPTGDAVVSELEIDEAEYHINLRKDADKANQFISGYSTDPEWNPNFDPERQAEIEKIISEK